MNCGFVDKYTKCIPIVNQVDNLFIDIFYVRLSILRHKVFHRNCSKQFDQQKIAKADESNIKQIKRIEKQDLIIIDDFGMQPLDDKTRMMLLEIIEDRNQNRSTIIASQVPVDKWYDIIGESTVADAILDRLVHTSHRIELSGESMRKKKKA